MEEKKCMFPLNCRHVLRKPLLISTKSDNPANCFHRGLAMFDLFNNYSMSARWI